MDCPVFTYHLRNRTAQLTFLLSRYFLNSSTPSKNIAKGIAKTKYLRSRGEVLKIRFADGFQIINASIRSSLAIPTRIVRLLNKPTVKADWYRVLEAKTFAI